MTRNYILLSGGPGLYDSQDPEHDQSWANYVTPPLQQTRTRQERNSFQATDEEVWWFIYRPAYERRWTDDQQRADRRHEPQRVMGLDCGGRLCRSYIDLLEYRARTRGWNLRWISSADDFWRRLRSFHDPISRVRYWGHARNDLWLSLRHDSAHRAVAPAAEEIIRSSDIHRNSALQSRFQTGSSSRRHIFSGCNTHTFASEWARVFRVYARGYEGTMRFTTTTPTGTMPGAACVVHNYAPGGSAEVLHEAASSSEYLDHRQGALQDTTAQVASERDLFAEFAHAAGMPGESALPDPEELYGEIMYNGHETRSALAENLTVLARPGESPEAPPQAGDIMLRVALGEPGLGYMAVLSDSRLWSDQQLANAPFTSEGRQPGYYAIVSGQGTRAQVHPGPFARRIMDSRGRLLPGQLLLRQRSGVKDGGDKIVGAGAEALQSGVEESEVVGRGPSSERALAEAERSTAARLEFINLSTAMGHGGRPHIYYVTTGAQGASYRQARFDLRITNTNDYYNLKRPHGQVRLYNIEPQRETLKYSSTFTTAEIEDEDHRDVSVYIPREALRNAHNPNSPRMRLDVYFSWDEGIWVGSGARPYYRQHSLGFYLVDQVEVLWRGVEPRRTVEFNNKDVHSRFWMFIHGKTFQRFDRTPSTITTRLTVRTTRERGGQVQVTRGVVRENGVQVSVQVGTERGSSMGINLADIVQAGLSRTDTASLGITRSFSTTRQFSRTVSESHSYSQTFEAESSIETTIPRGDPGYIYTLWAYPKFAEYHVPVVIFDRINEYGQATRRTRVENVPLLKPLGWETIVTRKRDPNQPRRR